MSSKTYLCAFTHVIKDDSYTGLYTSDLSDREERRAQLAADLGDYVDNVFITSTVDNAAYEALSEEKKIRAQMVWGVWKKSEVA